jgi:hypothetical protein
MKQLTLNISESKYQAFLDFVKTLDYVEIADVDKMALDELQNSFSEIRKMMDGELEKQTAEDFFNEL